MEGATDRRKDEDSPERESKALDDFREEIRERHGDSDDDKDNVQTNSGALSGKQDNASDTKPNEDVSETERSLERVKPSIVAEEKSERSEEFQVGTSNTEGGTAGRSEPSAEREAGHTDLEQFRDEVRKKYPEWAGNENHLSEDSDRTFRSEAENSGVLDSQTSKRVEWDGSDPPTGMHNIGTVEAVSQKDERNGIAEEADQPPFERVVQEVSFSAPKGNLGGGSRETGPENEKLNGSETANPNAEEVGDAEAHRFSDLERQRNAIEERSPNLQETSLHPEEKGVARVDTPREAGGWRTKESIGTSQKRDGAEPTSTTRAIGQGLQKEVENPDRGLAEASLRPYFSGSDRYRAVQFELRKSQLEDLCRTKLETGKIYRISGRIDGVCEFETFRRVSTASTLRINVPKDFHGRVERGQRYNVVISSIEEKKIDPSLAKILGGPQEMQKNVNISKWFQDRESLYQSVGSERVAGDDKSVVSIARQNFGRDGFHFNVSKSDIERSSGVVLGEGKRYEFKVTVGEMGQFVARHTQKRNDEIPIFVPLKYLDKVKEGHVHRITFDSITEQPRHRAEGTRDGIYLRIPWSDLETFGISRTGKSQRGKSVVELHVQNTSKPGELVKRYFASGESSSSVRILMRKENAREGDVFRLVGARNHHIADFLKDYDAFPSENTKNLKLSLQKDALAMAADGQEIRLRHPHLKAFGSRVSLSARLEGSNKGIKFQFDGERVTTRFSGGKLNEVNGNKHGIEFSYSPSRNMDYSFRQSVGQFDRNLLIDNLTFVTKPEREGEPYLFEVSPHLQESVEFRLGHTANFRKYLVPQGHISEEMQRHMLSLTEMWEEVKDHPFGKRLGPDSLQRSKLSDELYYFELKWEQKKGMVRTLHEGTQQVLRDYHECSSYKHERVAGAYVGMLDWDGGQFGYFWIERVWPEATRNE